MVRITSKQLAELKRAHGVLPAITTKVSCRRGVMNATEQRYYDEHLFPRLYTGEYIHVGFEEIRLRVGKGIAWYTPDFHVVRKDGKWEFHECKGGYTREASLVRLKAAAERYVATFFLCKYIGGAWSIVQI